MTKEVPEDLQEAARNFRHANRSRTLNAASGCLTLALALAAVILAMVVLI